MSDLVHGATLEREQDNNGANGEGLFASIREILLALHEVKIHLEAHDVIFSKLPEARGLASLFSTHSYVERLAETHSPLFGEHVEALLEDIKEKGELPESLNSEEGDILDDNLISFAEGVDALRDLLLSNADRVGFEGVKSSISGVMKEERGILAYLKEHDAPGATLSVEYSGAAIDKADKNQAQNHVLCTQAAIKMIDTLIAEGTFLLSELSEGSADLAFQALEYDDEVVNIQNRAIGEVAPILA
jgi:hypothetical protein